ncbi:hypothetical protein L484_026710 [Morus notabilis]|uniref:Uncharacterized protein n=1 Tax=Morus notabilis TaxID=981085 RepID=W9T0V7_9ROSA|nr:hypothetical protein L484_026710 [Morus notabilis]
MWTYGWKRGACGGDRIAGESTVVQRRWTDLGLPQLAKKMGLMDLSEVAPEEWASQGLRGVGVGSTGLVRRRVRLAKSCNSRGKLGGRGSGFPRQRDGHNGAASRRRR